MDKDFNSIRDLLFGQIIDPSSSGSNAVPLGKRNANSSATTSSSDAPKMDTENPPSLASVVDVDELDYDQTVRQLAFDKRAKPTDRTKTEEELAAEEAAKLEKAERARLRRMRGEGDDDDDLENDGKSRGAKRRRADADDLEDDFDLEEEGFGLGKGLGDADAELSSKESGSDASESSDDGSDGSKSSDDDDGGSDDLGASADEAPVEGDVEQLITSSSSRSKRKSTGSSGELPYTFPCPSTHDEFLDIIDGTKPSDLPVVVQRIRTIYHPSLGEANKDKLMVRYPHITFVLSTLTPV